MLGAYSKKCGFTLVEVLVVVAIMGVLSSLGVVGFRSAVANSRIKDAGINVTAFMQRAANEATRINSKACVVKADNKTLNLYAGDCDGDEMGELLDKFVLESINEFTTEGDCPVGDIEVYGEKVLLTPKIGVSPIPQGCFLIKYGGTDRRASSYKIPTKYAMSYMLSYSGGADWF